MKDVTLKISIKPFSIQIGIAIVLFKFDIGNFQIFKMHSERQLDVKRVIDFNKYIYTELHCHPAAKARLHFSLKLSTYIKLLD